MAELRWSVEALDDLDDVAAFISRQSPSFAPHFVARIVDAAERLASFPQMGRVIPEVGDPTIRELIFQSYRIVYALEDEETVILGVLNSALDFDRVAIERSWYLR